MSIRIRRLEAKDKAAWLPLFKGYIEFYKSNIPDDVIDMTWERLLSGKEGFHIGLVAVGEDDVPVGIAHVLFHRSTWSPTWYCYLEDLFVDPKVRGKDIGRALIEQVYAEAEVAILILELTASIQVGCGRCLDPVEPRIDVLQKRQPCVDCHAARAPVVELAEHERGHNEILCQRCDQG